VRTLNPPDLNAKNMGESFKYKTVYHNLQFISKQVNGGNLVLTSDLTEKSLRSAHDRSQFVETLLLGMPTEPIWCEEDQFGRHIVFDGSEKLKVLLNFIESRFILNGLRLRTDYENMNFSQLPYHENLGLVDRYNFQFIITNYDNAPELRHQLYRTLLRSKRHFKAQVARNFAFRGAFEFLQWLQHNSARYITFTGKHDTTNVSERDTRSDEIFLHLVLFILIERSGLGVTENMVEITLEDALDRAMNLIDSNETEATECANILLSTLARMKTSEGRLFEIELSRGSTERDFHRDRFTAKRFYQRFIQTRHDRYHKSLSETSMHPFLLSDRTPIKKLVDYILRNH
jgi:hypothetical protein